MITNKILLPLCLLAGQLVASATIPSNSNATDSISFAIGDPASRNSRKRAPELVIQKEQDHEEQQENQHKQLKVASLMARGLVSHNTDTLKLWLTWLDYRSLCKLSRVCNNWRATAEQVMLPTDPTVRMRNGNTIPINLLWAQRVNKIFEHAEKHRLPLSYAHEEIMAMAGRCRNPIGTLRTIMNQHKRSDLAADPKNQRPYVLADRILIALGDNNVPYGDHDLLLPQDDEIKDNARNWVPTIYASYAAHRHSSDPSLKNQESDEFFSHLRQLKKVYEDPAILDLPEADLDLLSKQELLAYENRYIKHCKKRVADLLRSLEDPGCHAEKVTALLAKTRQQFQSFLGNHLPLHYARDENDRASELINAGMAIGKLPEFYTFVANICAAQSTNAADTERAIEYMEKAIAYYETYYPHYQRLSPYLDVIQSAATYHQTLACKHEIAPIKHYARSLELAQQYAEAMDRIPLYEQIAENALRLADVCYKEKEIRKATAACKMADKALADAQALFNGKQRTLEKATAELLCDLAEKLPTATYKTAHATAKKTRFYRRILHRRLREVEAPDSQSSGITSSDWSSQASQEPADDGYTTPTG